MNKPNPLIKSSSIYSNLLFKILITSRILAIALLFGNCNNPDVNFYLNDLSIKTSIVDLSFRNLNEIPIQIGKLRNLRILDLSHNKLAQIPDEIWDLENLEELNLGWNELKYISPKIKQLKKLKIIILSSNQIDSIPEELSELVYLEKIEVSWNNIHELPQGIEKLGKLKSFLCYDNPLKEEEYTLLTNLSTKFQVELIYSLQKDQSQYFSNLANKCQQEKLIPQAIFYYKKAIEKNPENPLNYANIGFLFQNSENYDLAVYYYDLALKYNPNFADIYFNRGVIKYFYLKLPNEACNDWKQAAQLDFKEATDYLQKYCK